MLPPINIGRRASVSIRGAGAKGGAAGAAASAMTAVAGRVAQALTQELGLAEVDPRDRYTGGSASDAYGIEDMAAELNDALGGVPADRTRMARALHAFVQESASLITARPQSRSLTHIQAAIAVQADAARGHGSDVDRAIVAIDQATAHLRGPAR